ncbi:MAG: 4'-phosphopantetheinyl transferase superfamily protein [Acidobacteria bacterium]|nr:4'-phosphopantetheinyl transferase superfamily protein [Candidatus Sulfomarinibacter kjeldsenii]
MSKIEVLPGQVQLWWALLDVSDSEIDRLRGMLTQEELGRAERFRVTAAARRFIGARAALRMILGRATGTEPAEVGFLFGQHGKPRLPDGGLFFNASDSGDYVVVALTRAEVGVDIELARKVRRRDRLARRVCTDREIEMLARVSEEERDALLLRLWTCKEAALKAVGIGLSGGARNIEAEIPPNSAPRLSHLLEETDHWSLLFPDLLPNLLCSVVVKGSNWRAVSRQFSLHST